MGAVAAKRILIVEDERALARLVQVNLDRHGYETVIAGDGRAGLEEVRRAAPDLIILDVMMPVMDGFEMLRRLKADESTAGIPVMMLTAKADELSILQGWQEGVECYLTKPFDPAELVAFVQRLLEPSEWEE